MTEKEKEQIQRLDKMFIGFCDKQYKIGYMPYNGFSDEDIRFVTGEMINYNGGNIILANDDGVWHFPYKAIKWVLPIKNNNTKEVC